jgi:hypothetical protein
MSMNPYDPAHRQIWDLIPWLVNGTLDDEQREIAHRHLDRCIDCRDEFDFQLRIQGGMAVDAHAPVGDCSASLARLMARIDEEDEGYGYEHVSLNLISVAETQRTARRVHRQRRLMRMLAAMVVVEALGLAALGTLWFGRGSNPAQPAAYCHPEHGRSGSSGRHHSPGAIALAWHGRVASLARGNGPAHRRQQCDSDRTHPRSKRRSGHAIRERQDEYRGHRAAPARKPGRTAG